MTTHVPRRVLAALVSAITMALMTSGALWSPAGAAEDPRATAAATWLAHEVEAGGGILPNPLGEAPDLGLTADAIVALSLAGESTAARSASDVFFSRLGSYTTWDDLGDFPGVRLAGPYAKALLVAVVQGLEASEVGVGVEQELRSLVQVDGAHAGRFSDDNPHGVDDSNGFGQAVGLLALARTTGGAPPAALEFLLAQQCPDGGFRLFYDAARSCADSSQSDSDTTALAIQALLAVPPSPAVDGARAGAVTWLLALQDPATGAFSGTGPTDAPNANSTGVAAQALRAAGEQEAADRAASWVAGLQLGEGAAGAALDDLGAIAYDEAGRDAALGSGIGDIERDQWRRATAQAVLALGLPPLVPAAAQPPGTATTTTAPPTTPSSSTTTPSSTTTAPTVLGVQTRDHRSSSALNAASVDRRERTGLARTGADLGMFAGLGAASAVAGAAMIAAARTRRS